MILNDYTLLERDTNLNLFLNIRTDIMEDEDEYEEMDRTDFEDLAVEESKVILSNILNSGTQDPDFEFYEIELP